ncbi:MAG: ABC transporter ATP-binding protein [Bacilli bacterium]|nr:ABC transporter ATP-binding protein [Bacilli bacterium]
MDKEKILEVRDLSVGFVSHGKKVNVIRNVSMDVYQGETLAIVGESGSGKSVFTKTFTGMLDANGYISSGSIIFHGEDLAKKTKHEQWKGIRGKRIATIFQDPMTSLNPLLTIGYQIAEVLTLHHGMNLNDAKEEAVKLLEKVRIPDPRGRLNDYPFQYSGGMRQRVVIAIALACRPEILICDEPTTALDVTVQSQILELIKELQQEYKWTTIFITHDLGVVANVADRIAVMYGGQVVEYGTAEEIFYTPQHPYTWALLSSLPQLGTKNEPLTYIKGNPPSFVNEIIGDAFAIRNDYAMRIDHVQDPPMFKISDTHYAKTWLLDPRAPKVEKPKIIQNLRERMKQAAAELKREVGE